MSTDNNRKPNPSGKMALDPRNPALAQPFKRLVDEGFITELTVKFSPGGYTAFGKPDQRMVDVKDSGLSLGVETSVGILSAIADKGNLIPKGKKSKVSGNTEPPLPKKSLVKKDFEGTPEELLGRMRAVANDCTGATLVGRVRSAQMFGGTSTISFQNWWQTATPQARMVSLTLKKYSDEMGEAEYMKIGTMQCPFRGSAEFTVSSEEEDEEQAQPAPQQGSGSGSSPKK